MSISYDCQQTSEEPFPCSDYSENRIRYEDGRLAWYLSSSGLSKSNACGPEVTIAALEGSELASLGFPLQFGGGPQVHATVEGHLEPDRSEARAKRRTRILADIDAFHRGFVEQPSSPSAFPFDPSSLVVDINMDAVPIISEPQKEAVALAVSTTPSAEGVVLESGEVDTFRGNTDYAEIYEEPSEEEEEREVDDIYFINDAFAVELEEESHYDEYFLNLLGQASSCFPGKYRMQEHYPKFAREACKILDWWAPSGRVLNEEGDADHELFESWRMLIDDLHSGERDYLVGQSTCTFDFAIEEGLDVYVAVVGSRIFLPAFYLLDIFFNGNSTKRNNFIKNKIPRFNAFSDDCKSAGEFFACLLSCRFFFPSPSGKNREHHYCCLDSRGLLLVTALLEKELLSEEKRSKVYRFLVFLDLQFGMFRGKLPNHFFSVKFASPEDVQIFSRSDVDYKEQYANESELSSRPFISIYRKRSRETLMQLRTLCVKHDRKKIPISTGKRKRSAPRDEHCFAKPHPVPPKTPEPVESNSFLLDGEFEPFDGGIRLQTFGSFKPCFNFFVEPLGQDGKIYTAHPAFGSVDTKYDISQLEQLLEIVSKETREKDEIVARAQEVGAHNFACDLFKPASQFISPSVTLSSTRNGSTLASSETGTTNDVNIFRSSIFDASKPRLGHIRTAVSYVKCSAREDGLFGYVSRMALLMTSATLLEETPVGESDDGDDVSLKDAELLRCGMFIPIVPYETTSVQSGVLTNGVYISLQNQRKVVAVLLESIGLVRKSALRTRMFNLVHRLVFPSVRYHNEIDSCGFTTSLAIPSFRIGLLPYILYTLRSENVIYCETTIANSITSLLDVNYFPPLFACMEMRMLLYRYRSEGKFFDEAYYKRILDVAVNEFEAAVRCVEEALSDGNLRDSCAFINGKPLFVLRRAGECLIAMAEENAALKRENELLSEKLLQESSPVRAPAPISTRSSSGRALETSRIARERSKKRKANHLTTTEATPGDEQKIGEFDSSEEGEILIELPEEN